MTTATTPTPSIPFHARGALSQAVLERLTGRSAAPLGVLSGAAAHESTDPLRDDDLQLSLWMLYASAYGSVDGIDPAQEWDPELVETRLRLEEVFEVAVRTAVPVPTLPPAAQGAVARALFTLVDEDDGPSLSRFLARKATLEQAREFLIQRSIYTRREADPHSWAIPRLSGRAKAALVEIQADEYGGGRPERVHAEIFAKTLRGAGLDDTYAAYVEHVPAITLASHNLMSLFGLNRRLIGAIVGHLAAFEMTSSIPNRLYGDGFRRLGFSDDVTDYFDEHVEADAVHEQIAARDLAGALAEDRPDLLPDIIFGAAACLTIDALVGAELLEKWERGESSLRKAVPA